MWIKRSLVIVPVVLIAFLVQSIFWVPGVETVANNEARLDRLIFYMGANPEDMNSWTSTKTSDTTISDYLNEGLLRINQNYETEPWIADPVTVQHQMTFRLPTGQTPESIEALLRLKYGEKLKEFKVVAEAGEFGIDLKTLKESNEDAPGVFRFAKPAKVRIPLAPTPQKGKIVSAVEPDFDARLKEWLGTEPFSAWDVETLAANATAAATEELKAGLDAKKLSAAIGAMLEADGPDIAHAPIVDFTIQKGIHWVDGPFFDPADRKDPETGKELEYFGDPDGPFWVKGPEVQARDAKLTFDYLKDVNFNSPRRSSYTSIEESRIFEDDPYHFQVVYSELYSPALGDLTGSLLPYHVWNREAWTKEAIRKGRGPDDIGQKVAEGLSQWDPVPPGMYNPMLHLPSRDREFSLKPSSLGYMVLEPLHGDSLPLWENGTICRLRRNEFYWQRKPEFEFIDYYVFDPNMGRETAEVVFNSGGIDIYGARDFQVERYEEMTDRYTVIKRQPNQYEYLAFNNSRPQLSDPLVRKALSMAINVEEILQYVVYNQGSRINGPAYPVLPWYNEDHMITHTWRTDGKDAAGNVIKRKGKSEKMKFLPYDIDEARALLMEAGYKDVNGKLVKDGEPLRLQFINSSGGGARKNTALLAKEQWAKLGVDVKYDEYEWNVFIQQYVMALNFDVCVLGWSGGIDFDSRQLWRSDSWPTNGGLNLAAYSNPKADELMDKILKVYDYDEQVRISHEIFSVIANDFPYVFLYSPYSTTVLDGRIVWRKETGRDAQGNPIYEDRPVNHEFIKGARANLRYFFPELLRREDIPQWQDQDFKR